MNTDHSVKLSAADAATGRRDWMACLARASSSRLAELAARCDLPRYELLRGPETGLVMARGRMGGGGDAFNLGEMTVTRCSVRTLDGAVGHAWIGGRDLAHAQLAAAVDAAMQGASAATLRRDLLEPLAAEEAERRRALAERAATTRVDFFTLATMRS